MKLNERRIAFLAGILTNAWNSLNHAVGLADGESARSYGYCDKETTKIVNDAFLAVEKAKEHLSKAMDGVTDYSDYAEKGNSHA